MKILIVDDEVEILDILEELITDKYMCEVDRASNGLDAFILCQESEYSFIVTDHKMPFMTGAALISGIRTRKNLNMKTPILMLTGFLTDELKGRVDLEDVEFMSKPIQFKTFFELISSYVYKY
ncbi:response regulator [Halobacteriovorax marinus]|uniref:response regulator n=1 Tax=Halobacteriovorax marinus TaxID=97084 RepID=UPI00031C623C|nr:response regulator [Halobacteriovorax marinus]